MRALVFLLFFSLLCILGDCNATHILTESYHKVFCGNFFLNLIKLVYMEKLGVACILLEYKIIHVFLTKV